ncbi:MAG TPA: N-acetylglucosamine-6-phosphate deacetylase [Candidatus Brocadiia bacterium]|nr:N-acetylglucosamine-6-phosphate deacetylase [Candidatus Brocadiia bacterium]
MPDGKTVILTNARVLQGRRLRNPDVAVRAGKITYVGPHSDAPDGISVDLNGAVLSPGLIDLHTHGIERLYAADAPLAEYSLVEARHGVTSFLPTLIPREAEAFLATIRRIRQEMRADLPGAGCPGIYLEGPWLAARGGMNDRFLRQSMEDDLRERIMEAGGGGIRIIGLSPELIRAPGNIRNLTARGIVVAVTHTRCDIMQLNSATDAGASLATHLFDVYEQGRTTEPGVYPVGIVETILADDRIFAEIISDGVHVPPTWLRICLRCKGPERIVLVTDSMTGAGLPSGAYRLPDGAQITIREGDGARNSDGGLYGSALTMDRAVRGMVRFGKAALPDALRMASETPAALLGMSGRKGRIQPGYDADLTAFIPGDEYRVVMTMVAGRIVYRAPELA